MESHSYSICPETVDTVGFAAIGRDMPYEVIHHDNLESVLGLSGHDGTVLQSISYDPFGNQLSTTGTANNNQLHYTGREQDPDTGLYNYRARIYDPTTGTFCTEDQKGFAAGVNFYSYCLNNPINANDPYGLDALSTFLGWSSHVVNIAGIALPEVPVVKGAGLLLAGASAGYAGYQLYNGTTTSNMAYATMAQALGDATNGLAGKALLGPLGETVAHIALHTSNVVITAKDTVDTNAEATQSSGSSGTSDWQIPGVYSTPSTSLYNQYVDPATRNTSGTSFDLSGFSSTPAAGGYLIYPNKPNTNMVQSVYKK